MVRLIAARLPISLTNILGRITAQGDNMAHPHLPKRLHHLGNLIPTSPDAGQMGGGLWHPRVLTNARDQFLRALTGAAPRAIGHGDKSGIQLFQLLQRLPQLIGQGIGFGREKLKGKGDSKHGVIGANMGKKTGLTAKLSPVQSSQSIL